MTSTAVLAAVLVAVSVALLILMAVTVRQAITISDLRTKVATRDGIIDEKTQAAYDLEAVAVNLRKQCDGLIIENARLRQANTEKTDYVEHLALDLAEAKAEPKPTLREERIGAVMAPKPWKDDDLR
jgi:hypothetical protein